MGALSVFRLIVGGDVHYQPMDENKKKPQGGPSCGRQVFNHLLILMNNADTSLDLATRT